MKQRPALQSLREKHFCQLALQVVTKQVLFLKYIHPLKSNFLCDNFLKGEERSKSKIDLLLPQKSVLQKQNMLYLLLVRGSFLGNQISPTLEFFALRILHTLNLTMFFFFNPQNFLHCKLFKFHFPIRLSIFRIESGSGVHERVLHQHL